MVNLPKPDHCSVVKSSLAREALSDLTSGLAQYLERIKLPALGFCAVRRLDEANTGKCS
jgi:hypothetical protein